MSVFTEFFLVAFLIYLWESCLWLPLRTVALRRRLLGKRWGVVRPGQWWATRHLGLAAMLPIVPDTRLAPCQAPPLRVDGQGGMFLDINDTDSVPCTATDWSALREDGTRLMVDGATVRVSSPRTLEVLRAAKRRGLPPADGVPRMWRSALSPARARREWRKWRMLSAPMQPVCLLLTVGFFAGLPASYIHGGILSLLATALALWLCMWMVAGYLWWLGGRAYPTVKSSFRSDAVLSLLVPFHAMRAMEIASVHAMARTHPAALLIGTGDIDHPWLGRFVREIVFPRPESPHDEARCQAIRPFLEAALSTVGKKPEDYDTTAPRDDDPEATAWCPRCHALFSGNAATCTDCGDTPLRRF